MTTTSSYWREKTWLQRDGLCLAGLWALVTAYNLFKAYHIDDTVHLEIARWIGAHPLHPMSGLLNWSMVSEPIYKTNQPHLYFYLLAIWGRLFGFAEPAMHALQSFAALACMLLFYRLARHLIGPLAIWATALLVLGPAFVVEQNLMVDVPLLALWLVVFNALICDVDAERQTRRYGIVAIACAAAILVKYSSLVLFAILCLSLVMERRRAQAWTVLIPLAAVAAWSAFNFWDYGGIHILSRPHDATHSRLRFAMAWILALGALTPLGLVAAVQSRPTWRKANRLIYGAMAIVFSAQVVAVALGFLSDKASDKMLWLAFIDNGLLICVALARTAPPLGRPGFWRKPLARNEAAVVYLFVWVLATSLFYVIFSPFIAARHVLLVLPAVTLLIFGRWGSRFTPVAMTFALGFTVVISVGLCLSDWRFAAFYKAQAETLARSAPKSGVLWSSGHWGWQWYTERDGFRVLEATSTLRPGDELALAKDVDHQVLKAPPPMIRIASDVQGNPTLSLFCTARPARFYASTDRLGPWSLSRNCLNHIDLFKVTAR